VQAAPVLPNKLNDLSVDVSLSGVTQGDLFVRGATKWNRLAAAAGVLKCSGAGALPSWAALVSSDITTALGYTPVNRAGDTVTGQMRNSFLGSSVNDVTQDSIRVQPSGVLGANWRPIAVYTTSGATTPTWAVLSGGSMQFGGGGCTAVLNTFTDGADTYCSFGSPSVGNAFFRAVKYGGTVQSMALQFLDLTSNVVQLRSRGTTGSTSQAAILLACDTNMNVAQSVLVSFQNANVDKFRVEFNGDVHPSGSYFGSMVTTGAGSDTLYRNIFEWRPEWIVANNNTRTGRGRLFVYDFAAAREMQRFDTDGTQGLMSFWGGAAVAKQAVAGSRGGATVAVLTALLAALGAAGYNLITDNTTA
jgi:hypothetical protein